MKHSPGIPILALALLVSTLAPAARGRSQTTTGTRQSRAALFRQLSVAKSRNIPDIPPIWHLNLAKHGSLSIAEHFYHGLLEAQPSTETLLSQARTALRRGRERKALALVNQLLDAHPEEPRAYLLRGYIRGNRGQLEEALGDFDRVIAAAPQSPDAYLARGGVRFRLGRIAESITDFDRVAELEPGREPHLWQRGIAYYYQGQYADCARQFESHRTVNPNDVENAVWHYLCVAALEGAHRARERLLPVGADPRVPMAEILDLYRGAGSVQAVLDAADAGRPSTSTVRGRRFYAHLYIGLYYHAAHNRPRSLEHLRRATREYGQSHYMGEVARVHLERVKAPPESGEDR